MSFTTFITNDPKYGPHYRDKAVLLGWMYARADEYLDQPANKTYYLARQIADDKKKILAGAATACRLAVPTLATPPAPTTPLLAAPPAPGQQPLVAAARTQSAAAVLMQMEQFCTQVLTAGRLAYDQKFTNLRANHMPRDRYEFAAELGDGTVTTMHLRSFLDLLEHRVSPYHTDWGHGFNATNNIYIKAGETIQKIAAVRNQLPINAQAVEYEQWPAKGQWQDIETWCQFWGREITAFKSRKTKWEALVAAAGAGAGKTVKRNVTLPEANSIAANHGLRQGPPGTSFEKHKFFGGPGAAPGLGVLHPVVLTMVLKDGVYEWLQNHGNSTEGAPTGTPIDYSFATFFKAAEPHCYGIHEDALGYFNTLIHSIAIDKAAGQQINFRSVPAFAPGFTANYPADYHFPA